MTKLIELTRSKSKQKVLVAVDKIVTLAYIERYLSTAVNTIAGTIWVDESPLEIQRLIDEQ